MSQIHSCTITPSYRKLRVLLIGADGRKDPSCRPGRISVSLAGDPTFSTEGTLNSAGYLSGMAKLYKRLNLTDGMEVTYAFVPDGSIMVHSPSVVAEPVVTPTSLEAKTVFQAKQLKHIHIEPFRPESLNTWEPETETDIYLAFGVLQDYTDYQYCCGASKALLDKLGYLCDETSKPDAVLIDRRTDEYVMAEWKKYSSHFKSNHNPGDVDVLICWTDDESNRVVLPRTVIALHSIAKDVAATSLSE